MDIPLDRPLEAAPLQGLSGAEARERLRAEGYNELPRPDHRTPLRIVLEVLREPMLALLVVGGVLYLVLGDLHESIILFVFATMSVLITVIQESRTERVLDALRDLTCPRALVIRDGVRQRIAGRDVVRGDMVVLGEGDRVPADALLFDAQELQADESLLTGESVPVRKAVSANASAGDSNIVPGGNDQPMVYSGSLIVRGSGTAQVIATGAHSVIGKIGVSLRTIETEPSRLRFQIRRLVLLCSVAGGMVTLFSFLLYRTFVGGWIESLLNAITIGMSLLPEEFPVVLTIFMAMGAWRISRARVLTRRAAAIETLGSATVLCTDKTGTLTENRMTIAELRSANADVVFQHARPSSPLSAEARDVAYFGLLASSPEPFDPMEKAFASFAQEHLSPLHPASDFGLTLSHTYGLRPDLLAVTQLWQPDPSRPAWIVAAKGAPEAIVDLCHLPAEKRSHIRAAVDSMAASGLRVLGVARADHKSLSFPETPREFSFEFLGLVGLADPLRASVPAAVRECTSAGIRVVMITGDYPATARAIAREAGLEQAEALLTGTDVRHIDDQSLKEMCVHTNIFARVVPEQKLRIVQALKANGEIVAMTGDGVNDAPSLKAAHIGIAMGGRGTDVAREASAIVLLDDDFGSIVTAVRLGRRIYDNLRKAMGFIFAVHVPIAGLALLPLLLRLPVLFNPIHIAFLEMIIDPVCTLVFESEVEEEDVMRRPPRPSSEQLFSWPLIIWSFLQGFVVFLLAGSVYLVALYRRMPVNEARALTFFCLVMSIMSLILLNRSFSTSLIAAVRRPNPALAWIITGIAAILTLSLTTTYMRNMFHFGPLHWNDFALALTSAVTVLASLEFTKRYWRSQLRF